MRNLLNNRLGDYLVVEFLGAGGMGEVYRAVHTKIRRVVAIKILTWLDPHSNFNERFLNEARIHASLHHPNIATLYDFMEFEDHPCIIMEYVDGETLYDHIRRHGPLPLSSTLFILQAVTEAVAYCHSQGIIHRDIKSNNIKISSTGQVKLLDFGIAKDMQTPNLTVAGHYVGTLYYLSPEQITGKKTDARSDIWSLGILLYEMLTGRLPFEADSISEFCREINAMEYPLPSRLNPSIGPELERIVTRCLQKKPEDRYSSAEKMLEDIRIRSSLISSPRLESFGKSHPQSTPHRTKRFFDENWPVLISITALIGVLTIGSYFAIGSIKGSLPKADISMKHSGLAVNSTDRNSLLAPIFIDTYDGQAEVYQNGDYVGSTPYKNSYPIGSRVNFVLKRNGYEDKAIQFEVAEINNQYSYSLAKAKHD